MKDMMKFKGYFGSVLYSDEDRIFYGKLEFVKALVSYEGRDVDGLRNAFQEAVNDYLQLCEEKNIDTEKPFKGSFNTRPGTRLHRAAALYVKKTGTNLNQVVKEALEEYLSKKDTV